MHEKLTSALMWSALPRMIDVPCVWWYYIQRAVTSSSYCVFLVMQLTSLRNQHDALPFLANVHDVLQRVLRFQMGFQVSLCYYCKLQTCSHGENPIRRCKSQPDFKSEYRWRKLVVVPGRKFTTSTFFGARGMGRVNFISLSLMMVVVAALELPAVVVPMDWWLCRPMLLEAPIGLGRCC